MVFCLELFKKEWQHETRYLDPLPTHAPRRERFYKVLGIEPKWLVADTPEDEGVFVDWWFLVFQIIKFFITIATVNNVPIGANIMGNHANGRMSNSHLKSHSIK